MRSTADIKKAREVMEARIDRDEYPLLLLIWQSKRGALGAVCNEGKDPREADQNLEDVLASGADLDLPSFVKVQSARNVFAWVNEDLDSI